MEEKRTEKLNEEMINDQNQDNIQDANELHVNVKKRDTNDDLFDSDCCSVMSLVLTADGRLATSYFGLHTPEVVNAMKKITNQYFTKLKKEFKKQYKEEKKRIKGIKVFKDQNPEITDEQLLKLAEEFREMKRREEEEKAIELEKNKPEPNRPAVQPEVKKTSSRKSTANKSSNSSKNETAKKSTSSKQVSNKSSKSSNKPTTKK